MWKGEPTMKKVLKKIANCIVILILLGVAFLFFVMPVLEGKESDKIAAAIESLPGDLKAERINYNMLENRFTILNLRGTLKSPEGRDMTLLISEIVATGLNEDPLSAGKSGTVLQECLITHMNLKTSTEIEGLTAEVPRELQVERILLRNQQTGSLPVPKGGDDNAAVQAFYAFLEGMCAGDVDVETFSDTANTPQGPLRVSADTLLLQGGGSPSADNSFALMDKLLLPDIAGGQFGAEVDRKAILKGVAELLDKGGMLHVALKINSPLSMSKLAADNALPLNALVKFTAK
jgi:hypothetical protein